MSNLNFDIKRNYDIKTAEIQIYMYHYSIQFQSVESDNVEECSYGFDEASDATAILEFKKFRNQHSYQNNPYINWRLYRIEYGRLIEINC